MYTVSDVYRELSSAFAREYHLRFECSHLVNGSYEQYASYTQGDGIISVKVVNGQTTGDFTIGGTVCSTLEMTVTNNMPFMINDQIWVSVWFESPYGLSAGSENLSLGYFYIDSMSRNSQNTKITALDKMMQFAKNYDSALAYPSKTSNMLTEICQQSAVGTAESLEILNNADITEKPVKSTDENENPIYFTRREILGYLAGLNGGNAYIDKDLRINFSVPHRTGVTIGEKSVISQNIAGVTFNISNVIVNGDGTTKSTSDEWEDGSVQLYFPLKTDSQIASALNGILKGVTYDAVTIKKQGTGVFQLGDMVIFQANGKIYNMLIMGIVYDFSGGFFSETLYSLAKSESQRQYSGVENISQNIATAGTGGGGGGKSPEQQYDNIQTENLSVYGMYSNDGYCFFGGNNS